MATLRPLPSWLVALGPVAGLVLALPQCSMPPGHAPGTQVGGADACVPCHRPEYEGASAPVHRPRLPESCGDCHTEDSWRPSIYDHAIWTLDGAHARTVCTTCHEESWELDGLATECVGCHLEDYEGSTFPGHQDFPTTCQNCHSTDAWQPALMGPHDAFPLDGAHAETTCASCHGEPPSYDLPTECVGCHRDDYDRSPFPGHSDFPTTCADCHSTTAWQPALMGPHDAFPLDGAHAETTCASCHGEPPSYDLPTDCVGCHRDDYDRSPFPGHADFPTTCADCHSTTAWTPASGGHPENEFPIRGGAHGEIACTDCHDTDLSPSYAANVNCIGCHEHSQTRMDDKHNEEGDYQWDEGDPDFCRQCHPTGRGD